MEPRRIVLAHNYTMLITYFSRFSAPGERRTTDNGDIAGDVGGCVEPGCPVAFVYGDNDDGGRTRRYRRRHDPRGWCRHRARLLRER